MGIRDVVTYRYNNMTAKATIDEGAAQDVPFIEVPVDWGSHELVVYKPGYLTERIPFWTFILPRFVIPVSMYPNAPDWALAVVQERHEAYAGDFLYITAMLLACLIVVRGVYAMIDRHVWAGFWWFVLAPAQFVITIIVTFMVMREAGLYAVLVALVGFVLLLSKVVGTGCLRRLRVAVEREGNGFTNALILLFGFMWTGFKQCAAWARRGR